MAETPTSQHLYQLCPSVLPGSEREEHILFSVAIQTEETNNNHVIQRVLRVEEQKKPRQGIGQGKQQAGKEFPHRSGESHENRQEYFGLCWVGWNSMTRGTLSSGNELLGRLAWWFTVWSCSQPRGQECSYPSAKPDDWSSTLRTCTMEEENKFLQVVLRVRTSMCAYTYICNHTHNK